MTACCWFYYWYYNDYYLSFFILSLLELLLIIFLSRCKAVFKLAKVQSEISLYFIWKTLLVV